MPSDKSFILNPDNWPMWPFLPLKRYPKGGSIECCALNAATGLKLFATNIFNLPKTQEEFMQTQNTNTKALKNSFLMAGWWTKSR